MDIFDCLGRLADRYGQGGKPDRPAVEASAQRFEHRPGCPGKTDVVNTEEPKPVSGHRRVDGAVALHLREVADLSQQPVRYAGRASCAARDTAA